jgi:hypothetical protein
MMAARLELAGHYVGKNAKHGCSKQDGERQDDSISIKRHSCSTSRAVTVDTLAVT